MTYLHTKRFSNRHGQALIEFGLVALVLYLLIGAVVTFGIWFYVSGQIQQAAQVGARELSQIALPGDMTFEQALNEPEVRQRVYDDRWLVIDLNLLEDALEEDEDPDASFFTKVVPMMPLLNQQLALTYIVDVSADGSERLLRYPGAVLNRNPAVDPAISSAVPLPGFVRSDLIVQVPLVESRGDDGKENIRWLNVVEEIDVEIDPDDLDESDAGSEAEFESNPDPFQLFAVEEDADGELTVMPPPGPADSLHGVVALRINFPAQSPWLSSFESSDGVFPPPINAGSPNPALADIVGQEIGVQAVNPEDRLGDLRGEGLTGINQAGESVLTGTYGGNFGLGVHGALASPELLNLEPGTQAPGIRPYRRVLVSQAIFRREMYASPETPLSAPTPPTSAPSP